jgi:sigma-B regulation protein RsbU (phosphoserine phosphatase)
MCSSGPTGNFVTLALVVVDLATHRARVVNAGHMAPLIARHAGGVEEVDASGRRPAIGIFPNQAYQEVEVTIAAGDTIILFTDGVTEATNSQDQLYGAERLQQCIRRGTPTTEELGKAILSDIETFVDGNPQSDDICLICLRRKA